MRKCSKMAVILFLSLFMAGCQKREAEPTNVEVGMECPLKMGITVGAYEL